MTARWSPTSPAPGQLGRREAAGHVADERDAVRAEVEPRRGEQAADDEDERAGSLRGDDAQAEDHGERREPHDDRGPVDVGERAEPRRQLLPRVLAVGVRSRELRKLADHDVDGGAGEEPGDHRPGEELGDPAEPEHGHEQEQPAAHQRYRRDELGRLAAREARGDHGAAGDGRERRAGARRDLAAGPEDRVEERPRGRGVEPVLQRDAGDARVAEVLGDDERRDGDRGYDVPAQEPAVVARQPVADREADHGITARTAPRAAHGAGRGRSR